MAQLYLDNDELCGHIQLLCHAMLGEIQPCNCQLVLIRNYTREAVHTNVMAQQVVR